MRLCVKNCNVEVDFAAKVRLDGNQREAGKTEIRNSRSICSSWDILFTKVVADGKIFDMLVPRISNLNLLSSYFMLRPLFPPSTLHSLSFEKTEREWVCVCKNVKMCVCWNGCVCVGVCTSRDGCRCVSKCLWRCARVRQLVGKRVSGCVWLWVWVWVWVSDWEHEI